MTAHTPGPWSINWSGHGQNGKIVYDEVFVYSPECGSDDVAVASDIVDPLTGKPSEANARLIAAAPDLLEALEVLFEEADNFGVSGVYFNEKCMGHRGLDLARAAIAKATGEKACDR